MDKRDIALDLYALADRIDPHDDESETPFGTDAVNLRRLAAKVRGDADDIDKNLVALDLYGLADRLESYADRHYSSKDEATKARRIASAIRSC